MRSNDCLPFAVLLVTALTLAGRTAAQAPPSPTAPPPPTATQPDPRACEQPGQPENRGAPSTRGSAPTAGEGPPLSDRLAQTDGVICPPKGIDPEIVAPTPDVGRMPVIPPPGSPGGDPTARPK
jgi:hypothetical protein